MSTLGPPGAPNEPGPGGTGGPPPPPPGRRNSQPLRAILIVVVAVAIAVVVLARMSPAKSTASPTQSTVSTTTTTTAVVGSSTTSTTTSTSTTLPISTTTTTTVPAASVTVLVLNGWTTPHAALYFQQKLAKHGYDTLAPENAATNTNKTTYVYVANGTRQSTNAYQVAGIVGVGPAQVVVPNATNDAAIPPASLHQADLIVVVGEDISGQVPTGYAG
jgi:LytR cell envelope-related transcriptional attenuator